MQSNIPFSSQYDDCIHDLYRTFQAFKMQSIKIFPRYIYTPLMRFYLALQQMQADLAHEILFCLTESVRALLK